jgi:hypothetical protein
MTHPPFANIFNRRAARMWAFRLQNEIDQARGNIYNLVRADLGLPYGDVSDLRLLAQEEGYERSKMMLEFADQLWRVQIGLTEVQGVVE